MTPRTPLFSARRGSTARERRAMEKHSTGKANAAGSDAAGEIIIIRRSSANGSGEHLRIRYKGGDKEETRETSAGEKSLQFPRVLENGGFSNIEFETVIDDYSYYNYNNSRYYSRYGDC